MMEDDEKWKYLPNKDSYRTHLRKSVFKQKTNINFDVN